MRKTPGLVGATLLLAGPSPTGWVGSKYVRARFPCDIAPRQTTESPISGKSELCRSTPGLQARALRLVLLKDRQPAFEHSLQ
jgi:hypothetical protein